MFRSNTRTIRPSPPNDPRTRSHTQEAAALWLSAGHDSELVAGALVFVVLLVGSLLTAIVFHALLTGAKVSILM